MKNKLNFFGFLILIFFFNLVQISAQQFKYLSDEIKILDNGNTIIGKNNIEIEIGNHLRISADIYFLIISKFAFVELAFAPFV